LIWLAPAAVGVLGAVAVAVASLNAVRRAERLRVSLTRIGELQPHLRHLREDVRGLGATVDQLRRR
jgi:hypothetical protein